jgi:hypothetical protein
MKLASTDVRGQPQPCIVLPLARTVLRLFGILSSVHVLGVLAVDDSLSCVWGLLIVGIGLLSLWIYTSPKRKYYAPLILTAFYFSGYLLSLPYILLHKDEIPLRGWGSIGSFGFTDSEFAPVVLVILAGMSGVLTATLIAEKVFTRRNITAPSDDAGAQFVSPQRRYFWILLWFFLSACLVMLMWHLEIGRTGLTGKIRLPLKMVGLLYYLRQIFVPFCGILFLNECLRFNDAKAANLVLILLIAIGVLGAFGAVSRGAFAFNVFPAVLYLLFTSHGHNLNQKLFLRFSAASCVIAVAIVFLVQALRDYGYQTDSLKISESLSVLGGVRDFDFFKALSMFLHLATRRIGGLQELLAVSSSNIHGIGIPLRLFTGDGSFSDALTYTVFGFHPATTETLAFGISFGMWGQLYLSGSYWVVYLGTALYTGIIIFVEQIYHRKGVSSAALFFAVLLSFQLWCVVGMNYLSRFAVLMCMCVTFMSFLTGTTKPRH